MPQSQKQFYERSCKILGDSSSTSSSNKTRGKKKGEPWRKETERSGDQSGGQKQTKTEQNNACRAYIAKNPKYKACRYKVCLGKGIAQG